MRADYEVVGDHVCRAAAVVLVRVVAAPAVCVSWPELAEHRAGLCADWVAWLRRCWEIGVLRDAIEHASPTLAARIESLCTAGSGDERRVRAAVLSVMRYALRLGGRPTPNGLFAGVGVTRTASPADPALSQQGPGPGRLVHTAHAHADAGWLARVIESLEEQPGILDGLVVAANTAVLVIGDRCVVPARTPRPGIGPRRLSVSVRRTRIVGAALDATRRPVRVGELRTRLAAQFPHADAGRLGSLLATLVRHGVLISALHAPMTEPDALGHLVAQLRGAGPHAADMLKELVAIHQCLAHHRDAGPAAARALREDLAHRMRRLAPAPRHPVAIDLHVGGLGVLPESVARDAERAALLLARLRPHLRSRQPWADYHRRFYQRFGPGVQVPLREVVADSGIGWPAGYPDSSIPEPVPRRSARDAALLAIAQAAALDHRDEVTVDELPVTGATGATGDTGDTGDPDGAEQTHRTPDSGGSGATAGGRARGDVGLPGHLELCVRVDAPTPHALCTGRYRMTVTSVSRSVGVLSGRFLHLLEEAERRALTAPLREPPPRCDHAQGAESPPCAGVTTSLGADGHEQDVVVVAQLSFPPVDPGSGHVGRAVPMLPTVISLAEHRAPSSSENMPENTPEGAPGEVPAVLTLADLAVACDSERLYLTAPGLRARVEAYGLHALNPRTNTPALARLLLEVTRAHTGPVTEFDWGAAAGLPFLPRVRSGRVVLCPARWRVHAADLPEHGASWQRWDTAFGPWRQRRRLPQRVLLVDGDRHLPLDLDQTAHRVLLRDQIDARGHAVLDEAPAADAAGWLGHRAHEIVVPLAAHHPPPPCTTRARRTASSVAPGRGVATGPIVDPRDHGWTPGVGPLLFVTLYGDPRHQDTVLGAHVPELLARWGPQPPPWWFLRYQTGYEHCLRLRIVLPNAEPAVFGTAAARVGAWADRLRQQRLLRETALSTSYPDTGRWGSGAALAAAQAVFTADSEAVLAQLACRDRPHPLVLTAANFTAIATAFTGSTRAGTRWLIEHTPLHAAAPVPRPVLSAAQQLADPRAGFSALRAEPAGAAITRGWDRRARALAAYRTQLTSEPYGSTAEDGGPAITGAVPPPRGTDARDGRVVPSLDAALDSLLHGHFLRAHGIDPADKARCLYLARAAALAFTARTGATS